MNRFPVSTRQFFDRRLTSELSPNARARGPATVALAAVFVVVAGCSEPPREDGPATGKQSSALTPAQAYYPISVIGPVAESVDVNDINNGGVAVGSITTQTTPELIIHAFTHSDQNAPGTVTELSLPAPNQATGMDINEDGVVAGTLVTTRWNNWSEYGFRLPLGGPVEILTPVVFYANAINDRGQVAGYGYGVQGPVWRATGSTIQSLGHIIGPEYSDWAVGVGIGPDGETVGYNLIPAGGTRAFLHRDGLGMVDLNALSSDPAWVFENATATNGRHVVGWGKRNGEAQQGFRLDTYTGDVVHLGWGSPRDVNAYGDVVGEGSGTAFFYSDALGLVRLAEMIDPSLGWLATRASGLNDIGDVVGWGLLDGKHRGFKIRVPDSRACPPSANTCHDAGQRDAVTGQCTYPVSALGTPCNDGNPTTQGDICRAGTCSGSQLTLTAFGVVDTQDGNLAAVFGYDNPSSGPIRPDINAVNVNGILLKHPDPPPVLLPPGSHVGAYLPRFAASDTIAWTVDGQTVTASASLPHLPAVPIDESGFEVVVAGRKVTVEKVTASAPPAPGDAEAAAEIMDDATELASYFAYVKAAVDFIVWVGPMIGLWKTFEQRVEADLDQVLVALRFLDWKASENFIMENYNPLVEAMRSYDRTRTPSTESDNRMEAAHLDNLRGIQNFCRTEDESATDGPWKQAITVRAPRDCGAGGVYDWRRGLPVLMQAAAMRIFLIGTQDPEFRASHSYNEELTDLRDTLSDHYDRILRGIACGNGYCADIYSGTYAKGSSVASHHQLASQLMQKLPLFALRAMVDTLTLYIGDAMDLTEQYSQIPAGDAPRLCIESTGDQSQPGNLARMAPCNRQESQAWIFDRVTNTIRKPGSYWCLEVVRGAAIVPGQPLSAPPVWTNWCNDSNSQRWTYDPIHRVLRSALGTALDFSSANLAVQARWLGKHLDIRQQGMLATEMEWLDGSEATPNQRWRADQPIDLQVSPPSSSCGRLGPGEGLLPGEMVLSCDGELRLTLGIDGNVALAPGVNLPAPSSPPPSSSGSSVRLRRIPGPWATETRGIVPSMLVMQTDGNLVLYNSTGAPVWSSNTWNHPGAALVIEDDGAMVIRDQDQSVLWRTGPEQQYREHRSAPSVLWYNSTSGELATWLVDDLGMVTDQRALSWRCDTASGCATEWRLVAVSDFSGDGIKDVAWYSNTSGEISVWVLGPTGAVQRTQTLSWRCERGPCYNPFVTSWEVAGAFDANHDGNVDLLWQRGLELSVWLLDSDGTVTGSQGLPVRPTPANWRLMSTIDANDDGEDELLLVHQGTLSDPGRLAAWSPGTQSMTLLGPMTCAGTACVPWKVVGTGDFNGDALDDILWFNATTGEMSAWLLDGQGTTTGSLSLSLRCDDLSLCSSLWKPVGLLNLR